MKRRKENARKFQHLQLIIFSKDSIRGAEATRRARGLVGSWEPKVVLFQNVARFSLQALRKGLCSVWCSVVDSYNDHIFQMKNLDTWPGKIFFFWCVYSYEKFMKHTILYQSFPSKSWTCNHNSWILDIQNKNYLLRQLLEICWYCGLLTLRTVINCGL